MTRPAAACAAWLLLALAVQAASLSLIDAGTAVGYQHYRPPLRGAGAGELLALGVLGTAALAAALGLARRGAALVRFARAQVGTARALALLAAVALLAAFPSLDPRAFAAELALAAGIRLVQLACVGLAAAALPAAALPALAERARAWLGPARGDPTPIGVDRFAAGAAAFAALAAAALAVGAYERHPHVPDEVAYVFHARYLATGALSAPAPPVPGAYDVYLIDCDDERCITPFPPGWPAVLALGERLGAGWLVNPLLAGACVLLAHALLGALYDRRTARLGVLLLCASPWFVFLSMSFMSHTFTLCASLLGALATLQLVRSGRARFGIAAGLAAGAVGLTRPLEGLALAGVLGPAALFARGRRWRLSPALAVGLAALAMVALTLPYNAALTGDPLHFPLMAYTDRVFGEGSNALGFGPDRDWGWRGLDPLPGHGPLDVVVNAYLNSVALDIELFGWAAGSLLPLLFFVLCARKSRADAWMLVSLAAVVGLHSLYWFSGGPDFGARYWFLTLIPCVALSARGLTELARRTAESSGEGTAGEARVWLAAAALCAIAWATFFPWRAVDKYHGYRGMRPGVRTWIAREEPGAALVLVRGASHPDYASAFVYNPIDPRAPEPVFVRHGDPVHRASLLAAYPERSVYLLDGPTRTGDGYRRAAGPLTGADRARAVVGAGAGAPAREAEDAPRDAR